MTPPTEAEVAELAGLIPHNLSPGEIARRILTAGNRRPHGDFTVPERVRSTVESYLKQTLETDIAECLIKDLIEALERTWSPELVTDAEYVAATMALVRGNLPPDIQELLILGDPAPDTKPKLLRTALEAARKVRS